VQILSEKELQQELSTSVLLRLLDFAVAENRALRKETCKGLRLLLGSSARSKLFLCQTIKARIVQALALGNEQTDVYIC